jgi:hypothetical protein
MPGNPLVAQGTLNRLRASIIWTDYPQLNVTAAYLGRMGIRLALDGDSTLFIPTMAGTVASPEPYMQVTATIHLLKTQLLAIAYKAQLEATALIGTGIIRGDAATLPPFTINNCAIQSVAELNFAGDDGDFAVRVRGYYLVNANLWD